MVKKNACIFISGKGTNLNNILNKSIDYTFPIHVKLIVCSSRHAKGLVFAKQRSIPIFIIQNNLISQMKLINETHKIFDDYSIRVTATAIRIPVVGGHSESINVELKKNFDLVEIRKLLSDSPGIIVQDNPDTNTYPMPIYAAGKNEVFVGRIRKDESQDKTINLWVVADNLRKGAATNAIQIAEYLLQENFI